MITIGNNVFVTGVAGFIGNGLALELLKAGYKVVGIDDLDDYYSVELKCDRLKRLGVDRDSLEWGRKYGSSDYPNFTFLRVALEDKGNIDRLFDEYAFDYVVNLAGQAGVRYSVTNPYRYLESNVHGFLNLLEACRAHPVKHLVYASSSSVYGRNDSVPFAESAATDKPVSLYAAFKKSNELMAYAYASLYGMASTGLRFFTVYGPWGRPDMAPMLFADAISGGGSIRLFNGGDMARDFTYIDDVVDGIVVTLQRPPQQEECVSGVRTKIYNIGCGHSVKLADFVDELERQMGRKAEKVLMPMQKGDVYRTFADTSLLSDECGYKPHVQLSEGLAEFVAWYRSYYKK